MPAATRWLWDRAEVSPESVSVESDAPARGRRPLTVTVAGWITLVLALGLGVVVGAWALLMGAVPAALVVVLLFTPSARSWFPELFYAR